MGGEINSRVISIITNPLPRAGVQPGRNEEPKEEASSISFAEAISLVSDFRDINNTQPNNSPRQIASA